MTRISIRSRFDVESLISMNSHCKTEKVASHPNLFSRANIDKDFNLSE